jgi:hypothetical protein
MPPTLCALHDLLPRFVLGLLWADGRLEGAADGGNNKGFRQARSAILRIGVLCWTHGPLASGARQRDLPQARAHPARSAC